MNLDKEFDFIIKETHKEKASAKNFFKRRLLLAMQILLPKRDFKTYKFLKQIYLKTKKKDIESISQFLWQFRDIV